MLAGKRADGITPKFSVMLVGARFKAVAGSAVGSTVDVLVTGA